GRCPAPVGPVGGERGGLPRGRGVAVGVAARVPPAVFATGLSILRPAAEPRGAGERVRAGGPRRGPGGGAAVPAGVRGGAGAGGAAAGVGDPPPWTPLHRPRPPEPGPVASRPGPDRRRPGVSRRGGRGGLRAGRGAPGPRRGGAAAGWYRGSP